MEDLNSPEVEAPKYGRMILVNKFSENWEVSARVGTQAYLGEYVHTDFYFKDWWNFPAIDIGLQKWGTNSIGLALGFTYSPLKTLYFVDEGWQQERKYCNFATDNDPIYIGKRSGTHPGNWYLASGKMGNVYLQAIFNFSNIIGGYKASRFYTAIFAIGGGMMFPMQETRYREICASFNAGINNKFRIASHLTLDVEIRGTLHDDMFNGVSYYNTDDVPNLSVDATIGATVGLSYRFNWTKSKKRDANGRRINEEGWTTVDDIIQQTPDYQNLKAEADAVSAAVAAATAALADANDKIAEQQKTIREKDVLIGEITRKEPFSYRQIVNFVIDTWDISNREKVGIMFAADVIRQHPDTKFVIAGYADVQTATPSHNLMLSEHRAEEVYNCLVNEFGVNPDQLEKAFFGGVDYMFFNDKQCSRSALITTKDDFKPVIANSPLE